MPIWNEKSRLSDCPSSVRQEPRQLLIHEFSPSACLAWVEGFRTSKAQDSLGNGIACVKCVSQPCLQCRWGVVVWSLLWGIVEAPLASVVGAWVYTE